MGELKGKGAVIGRATGIARLPNDPEFKEGDILVASMTVPDNVPVMKIAAGIATDRGSITCHAALIASEFGKPCVVATREATKLKGKLVTINVKGIREAGITW